MNPLLVISLIISSTIFWWKCLSIIKFVSFRMAIEWKSPHDDTPCDCLHELIYIKCSLILSQKDNYTFYGISHLLYSNLAIFAILRSLCQLEWIKLLLITKVFNWTFFCSFRRRPGNQPNNRTTNQPADL